MKTLLSYLGVTIGAIMLALVLASQFMPQGHSQQPVPAAPAAKPMAPVAPQVAAPAVPIPPASAPAPVVDKKGGAAQPVQPLPPIPAASPAAKTEVGTNPLPPQGSPNSQKVAPITKPSDLLSGIIEDFTYNAEGRRDPFQPFETGPSTNARVGPVMELEKFDVDQLRLVGVIYDVKNPKAMILDPTGKGHVVRLNERIGRNNGYVARIRAGELVIIESFTSSEGKVSYQTKVVKLSQN